jgi:formamidopyrimidine-DNA glycosylase
MTSNYNSFIMPELPEVETIRRGLEGLIVGATITDVEVRLPKMVRGEVQKVPGAKVQKVRRRGKGLLIELDNSYTIAVHVKMTGQLIYRSVSRVPRVPKVSSVGEVAAGEVKNLHPVLAAPLELPNKHTHVIFTLSHTPRHPELDSGSKKMPKQVRHDSKKEDAYLYYNDIRQFGWIHVLPTAEVESLPFFMRLGPEPLTSLTREHFNALTSRSKAPIKQVLMDQSRLAGVGNIYANDALFHAGIHPLRPANDLTDEEQKKLFIAVEYVLTEGIKAGGASEENFLNALGEKGFYQEKFLVYKKTGKPCKRCGTPIERMVIGGRGTFYCPLCQL